MLVLRRGRNGLLPFLLHAYLLSMIVTALPPGQWDGSSFGFAPTDGSAPTDSYGPGPQQEIATHPGEPEMAEQGQYGDLFNYPFGNVPAHPGERGPATSFSHPSHFSPDYTIPWSNSPYPDASIPQLPTDGSGDTGAGFASELTFPPGQSYDPSVSGYLNFSPNGHQAPYGNHLYPIVDNSLSGTYGGNLEQFPLAQAGDAREQPNRQLSPVVWGNLNNGQETKPGIDGGSMMKVLSAQGSFWPYTAGPYTAGPFDPSYPGNLDEHFIPGGLFPIDGTGSVPTLVPGHPPVPETYNFQNLGSLNHDSSVRPPTAGGGSTAGASPDPQFNQAVPSAITPVYYATSRNFPESAPVIPSFTNGMIPGPPTASPDGQWTDPSALAPNLDPQSSLPGDSADPHQITGGSDSQWTSKTKNALQGRVVIFDINNVRKWDRLSSGLDIATSSYVLHFEDMANQLHTSPSFQHFMSTLYRRTAIWKADRIRPFLYVLSAAFVDYCDSQFGSLELFGRGSVENAAVPSESQYFHQARQYADLIKDAYIRQWFIKNWKLKAQHATVDAVVLWHYLKHVVPELRSKLSNEVLALKSPQRQNWPKRLRDKELVLQFLETEELNYREYLVNELCLPEGSASGEPLQNSLEIMIRKYAESLRHVDDQAPIILELLDPSCSEETIVNAAVFSMDRRYGDLCKRNLVNMGTRVRKKTNFYSLFAEMPIPATVLLGYRQAFHEDLAALSSISSRFKKLVSMPLFYGIELPLKEIPIATEESPVIALSELFTVNPAFEMLFVPKRADGTSFRTIHPKGADAMASSTLFHGL
ncbi:hypothetical protein CAUPRSCDRAFT_11682 [Caulochytrium protostelioides]|uniref:Uncharacterized protein n=1 Tax=Caulochytrium protostelioides TaxID=1555241 RepID=A0A4P9WTN8_9FUNG|nr:hypothetical protein CAUPRSCDRAFT_11682 [Caulochytrium protostelioides]